MKLDGLAEARFWAKTDKRSPNECWPWVGAKGSRGYGVMKVSGKQRGAHRVSYALHNDDYDILAPLDSVKGPYVLHSCDNRICVNPAHLRLGTALDNSWDADERGRRNPQPPKDRWLHCKLGPEAVREIRLKAQTWEGVCDMMKKHNTCQGHIERIADGKAYNWFEPENLPVRE